MFFNAGTSGNLLDAAGKTERILLYSSKSNSVYWAEIADAKQMTTLSMVENILLWLELKCTDFDLLN